jgi:hypothetical protein
MTGLKSGNQTVAKVTKWNQQYLSGRIRFVFFGAGSTLQLMRSE